MYSPFIVELQSVAKMVSVDVRRCLKQNFLSNPRRIHSKEEDEEKEE
jgi:hypothetical protein